MLKHTLTYTDFNGEQITEDLYFHMSEADLIRLDATYPQGLESAINEMVEADDKMAIFEMFETLVARAYGQKSEDGKRFVRNEQVREEFLQTAAYEALVSELVMDEEAAAKFFSAMVPQQLLSRAEEQVKPAGNGERRTRPIRQGNRA
jgi:hypothetical protein